MELIFTLTTNTNTNTTTTTTSTTNLHSFIKKTEKNNNLNNI